VKRYPQLDATLLRRLARAYGTFAADLLGARQTGAELGEHFGAGLYACEVDYLVANEWAETTEDVLWRRTKLGLRTTEDEQNRLAAYLAGAHEGVRETA